MEDLSPFPGPELLDSDDPARWAARFVMLAALDPGFAVDEVMVAWWFGWAFLAAKKTGLGELEAGQARMKRALMLNRKLVICLNVLLVVFVTLTVLRAAGVVR